MSLSKYGDRSTCPDHRNSRFQILFKLPAIQAFWIPPSSKIPLSLTSHGVLRQYHCTQSQVVNKQSAHGKQAIAYRRVAHVHDIDLDNPTALPKSRGSGSRSQSHANSIDESLPPFPTKRLLTSLLRTTHIPPVSPSLS